MGNRSNEITSAARKVRARALREIVEDSPFVAMRKLRGEIRNVADAFNDAREKVVSLNEAITRIEGNNENVRRMFDAIYGHSVSRMCYKFCVTPSDVENEDSFIELLNGIVSCNDFCERMKMCVKANETIAGCISSWVSKIDKMRLLTERSGASEGEIENAGVKIAQFEIVVEALRKRGESLATMFYDYLKKVRSYCDSQSKAFVPVFDK